MAAIIGKMLQERWTNKHEMQRFIITPIVDCGGRKYFVVNYPRRGTSGRKQKKFNTLARAEEFRAEIRREWAQTGKIKLGLDARLHGDVLRATRLLQQNGDANATHERAAYVYLQCVSMAEKRDMKYEVPTHRGVELSPRVFLLAVNEARARNISVSQAVEGLLSEVALCRAEQAIRRATETEEKQYRELKQRNKRDGEKLRELKLEARIWEQFNKGDMMYERGRASVLGRHAEYQRRWRARKKERESQRGEERGNGSGN